MQMLERYYVQYFNYQYNRTGTLWEGRYKATVLDSEQWTKSGLQPIDPANDSLLTLWSNWFACQGGAQVICAGF